MKKIYLLFVLLIIESLSFAIIFKPKVETIILKNPISYSFSFEKDKINEVLRGMVDKDYNADWMIIAEKENFQIMICHNKSNFHKVKGTPSNQQNTSFGEISGFLNIILIPEGEKTLVKFNTNKYSINVGRKLDWIPHGGSPVEKEVPTSTFIEYSFLLKLGELLGEKGMPAINTDPAKGKVVVS